MSCRPVGEHNRSRPSGYPLAYSVGSAALDPSRHPTLAEWLREADAAMYREKRRRA